MTTQEEMAKSFQLMVEHKDYLQESERLEKGFEENFQMAYKIHNAVIYL